MVGRDLVAPGVQNVWICEVGSKRLNGSFEDFQQSIAASGLLTMLMIILIRVEDPDTVESPLFCWKILKCFATLK